MKWYIILSTMYLGFCAAADPTWPSEVDELEEIMFQLTSFRARQFSDTVSPCSKEASGPGRQNAAEWLRTAFHDMSTANIASGTGGLDASIQYELNSDENAGPGLRTTLESMAPFFSTQTSLSDLIALGVYVSVRSCGGPAVAVRAGRRDATERGNPGVPQAEDSVSDFARIFEWMGFTHEEAIQVTACGHTLGGVHTAQFADIVPPGSTTNGVADLDSSTAVFDNKIVTEYLSGNTKNPLVVGPSVKISKHSDFKLFNSDGNNTMTRMADNNEFKEVCKVVLQKMIDTVPSGVELSRSILPYMVNPVDLQLTLEDGGSNILLTGFIRVKTTGDPGGSIESVTVTYKNRQGHSSCGSTSCSITATAQGQSRGFDDTFDFFPIAARIPVSSGIYSFVVTVNNANGTRTRYDNGGKEYPLRDAIFLQKPQSCLQGSSGALRLVAAVRNGRLSQGAKATIFYKVPQSNSPVPALRTTTLDVARENCVGDYTFFTVEHKVEGGLAHESRIDVSNGDMSDSFKNVNDIGDTCRPFSSPPSCNGYISPRRVGGVVSKQLRREFSRRDIGS
ncbi:heme peroxidase [Ilyonectria robusta]|uniref:heme peroxidase n=1 Tax=Ilyonectria robusta TaxID=1079257 RepID=UPI001E8CD9CF|nr:heme peroxidase [Ilyonectria robusta]KAH8733408.1 heme peroxidase [Ilyonectria robusta]